MPRLDGKVAVVTGAAAGPKAALGAIFAKALAAEGAKVVLADTKGLRSSRRRDRSQRWNRARRPC